MDRYGEALVASHPSSVDAGYLGSRSTDDMEARSIAISTFLEQNMVRNPELDTALRGPAVAQSSDMGVTAVTRTPNMTAPAMDEAPLMGRGTKAEEFVMTPDMEGVDTRADNTGAMGQDEAGLMEPNADIQPAVSTQETEPTVATQETEPTVATQTFSTVTNNLYNAFTVGGQEGTEAHVGLDSDNITLPAGIVADGLVYNGKTIDAGQNTIPASSFDISLLDTSGAYKTIGTGNTAVTIRRSDYTSDQDFSKAVIAEFENRAKTAAGSNWDNIPEDAQEAIVKIGWNLGTGWYNGNSAKTLYEELASETPDIERINRSILRASTVRGGGASIGIAKARADAYNAARDAFNGAEITRIDADNSGANTAFKYYDAAGNLVHTEQTNRASNIYQNGNTLRVSKNSAGVW
jgi:GH24 family phage-related lysozyme (muramidase)